MDNAHIVVYVSNMGKRRTALSKKTTFAKKSPKRLAAKKKMLEEKAMRPADRKKARAKQ